MSTLLNANGISTGRVCDKRSKNAAKMLDTQSRHFKLRCKTLAATAQLRQRTGDGNTKPIDGGKTCKWLPGHTIKRDILSSLAGSVLCQKWDKTAQEFTLCIEYVLFICKGKACAERGPVEGYMLGFRLKSNTVKKLCGYYLIIMKQKFYIRQLYGTSI